MKWPSYLCIIAGGIGISLFADSIEFGSITGSRVNVRGRPLDTAEICCQLSKGSLVEIVERRLVQTMGTNTEEWVRIILPEKALVWIQSSYVDPENKVTTRVNGRAGPSLMWPVLCVFSPGDIVQPRTNNVDWIGISPPRSATAWVSGDYVARENVQIPTAKISDIP
jgi:hypothetical protein